MTPHPCPPAQSWWASRLGACLCLCSLVAHGACEDVPAPSRSEDAGTSGQPMATMPATTPDASVESGPLDAGVSDAGGGPAATGASEAAIEDDAAVADSATDAGESHTDAGADARPRPAPSPAADLCALAPSQVLVIGDSLFAMDPSLLGDTQPFRRSLEALAREAGALEPDAHYRDHSRSYATLIPGPVLPAIPAQYADARGVDPDVQLLVLNGGGNDLLFYYRQCLVHESVGAWAADPSCVESAQEVLDAMTDLLTMAFEDGVQAVVFVAYPAWEDELRVFLEYITPKLKGICAKQSDGQCHFVDLRTSFDADADGAPDPELFTTDGRHPSEQGSRVMAAEVRDAMQMACATGG